VQKPMGHYTPALSLLGMISGKAWGWAFRPLQ